MIRAILVGILILVAARIFWKVMDALIEGAGGRSGRQRSPSAVKLVRDPVCGTYVSPGNSLSVEAGGTTHFFCSERCRTEFQRRA